MSLARAFMLQGTGTDVGKSVLVAGLCRALVRRGFSVRPFKPQNMSNNAAVTGDGGEIGRAQALQARACRVETSVHMNPVLLKPQSETGSQVVVQGKIFATARARDYQGLKPQLMHYVMESFALLRGQADFVVVEGAGSASEVNLRSNDIANMGFARAAKVPVVLVGDIDRGGVIAQIAGTKAVIPPLDAAMVAGFIINKFRGDATLFEAGMRLIEQHSGWPALGLVPFFTDAAKLPAEDAMALQTARAAGGGRLKVAVPVLPCIANFDDFDPLLAEPEVQLLMVAMDKALPGDADAIILPGSKATIADLAAFRAAGLDIDLAAHVRRGGHVLGICGGYQMLGQAIHDLEGVEGLPGSASGLGLLDVTTVLTQQKTLTRVNGLSREGAAFSGYEIHVGVTQGADAGTPMLRLSDGRPEGAVSASGLIQGCYVHGLFGHDAFRASWLAGFGAAASGQSYDGGVDKVLDDLAAHLETHVDIDRIIALAR